MCLGIAGQIIEILQQPKDLARADVFGVERTINVGLLANEELNPGDWILTHVGFAIAKMDEDEAKNSMSFLRSMGDAFIDEMAAALGKARDEDQSTASFIRSTKSNKP